MKIAINRAICLLLLAAFCFPSNALAFEIPLGDITVREAYFLGQRNDDRTAAALKPYSTSFNLPDKGPYISEIHLLTPYAQVVTNSSQHTNGYSAQQAAADYHGRGDTILLQVRIELTLTFTYDDATRVANDYAGEINRQLYPEDFWRSFRYGLSQKNQSFEARDAWADPIYASNSPRDRSQSLRGVIVWLEYDASQFEQAPARAEVIVPGAQGITASFDLAKLR
jgi:hypothetical protein